MEKIKVSALLLVGILFVLSIYGAASHVLSQQLSGNVSFSLDDNAGTELVLDLTLDKENYNKGELVQIWCAVVDSENNPVINGTAEIQLSCQNWNQKRTIQIVGGVVNYNYAISYGNPGGSWAITVTAEDNLGNSGTAAENITVIIPTHVYYTVQFSSPVSGLGYTRGENVEISVDVSGGGVAVENAEVFVNSPTGENIALVGTNPGTYSVVYTIKWDDPLDNWCISAEAKKTVGSEFKAGGSWIPIQIKPAAINVVLLSPTQRTFKVEESTEVKVQVSYPDGTAIENLSVNTLTPRGENLPLVYEENGIYGAACSFSSEDAGSWFLEVVVTDPSGNSGSRATIIDIVQPSAVETIFSKYWWAFLSAVIAAGVASVYLSKRMRADIRMERIKREMAELEKLEKDAVVRYFKEGAISRSAFDVLIKKFERRRAELTTERGILETKIRKKAKTEKKGEVKKRARK